MIASRLKVLAATGACLLLASCAQTGPPLPPSLELPKAPTDLRAVRKGNVVTLTWSEPTRTTDRQSVRYLGPTNICRSMESEMKECGNPVGELPAPAKATQPSAVGQANVYRDTLPAAVLANNPTGDVAYAVEVLNRDRRAAGLSNRALVPALPILPPPSDFQAELASGGVNFVWTSAGGTAIPTGVQLRYRIYRREDSTAKDAVAIELPVGDAGPARAQDTNFEWEKTYLYRITAVSIGMRPGGDAQVEGDDSPEVRVVAHDVFPPSVPSGVQAVFSGDSQKPFIDLIWAPATDADLAGYNIYRHEEGGAATKINAELVKSPSYRDDVVASGRKYIYSISSQDVRGNESARSEEASETVP